MKEVSDGWQATKVSPERQRKYFTAGFKCIGFR